MVSFGAEDTGSKHGGKIGIYQLKLFPCEEGRSEGKKASYDDATV